MVDQRQVVRLLAVTRLAIGAFAWVAPAVAGRFVAGARARDPIITLLVRAFAARDLVIGYGTLRALREDRDPAAWARLAAVCDGADSLAALAALRSLPFTRGMTAAVSASVAAAAGWRASSRLD